MSSLEIAYNTVFDNEGNIRLCGREACKDLIIELSKKYPGVYFGNISTGMLNVEEVKKYRGNLS